MLAVYSILKPSERQKGAAEPIGHREILDKQATKRQRTSAALNLCIFAGTIVVKQGLSWFELA